jgi:hypothetical protein
VYIEKILNDNFDITQLLIEKSYYDVDLINQLDTHFRRNLAKYCLKNGTPSDLLLNWLNIDDILQNHQLYLITLRKNLNELPICDDIISQILDFIGK